VLKTTGDASMEQACSCVDKGKPYELLDSMEGDTKEKT
jgi:hypothetical protein